VRERIDAVCASLRARAALKATAPRASIAARARGAKVRDRLW
jgi:hypothetical protein